MTTAETPPIFTAAIHQEDLNVLAAQVAAVSEAISLIEKPTGRILTYANHAKDNALISFGHDVFAALFFSPIQIRSIGQFLKKSAQKEHPEISRNNLCAIEDFFARLESLSRIPVDKTIRGKLYPANWKSRTNIPSLTRKAHEHGDLPSEFAAELANVDEAVKTLHDECLVARRILTPYLRDIAQKRKDWIENTPEGQAHNAEIKKQVASILSTPSAQ